MSWDFGEKKGRPKRVATSPIEASAKESRTETSTEVVDEMEGTNPKA